MKNKQRVFLLMLFLLCFSLSACGIGSSNFWAAGGQSAYEHGDYAQAVNRLEKAIQIRPEHGRAHYYLALSYIKLGQQAKAADMLRAYLSAAIQTDKRLTSMDQEYIAKCQSLLNGG